LALTSKAARKPRVRLDQDDDADGAGRDGAHRHASDDARGTYRRVLHAILGKLIEGVPSCIVELNAFAGHGVLPSDHSATLWHFPEALGVGSSAMLKVRPRSAFVAPCIPTRALKPPAGPEWVHEIKHDGYRLQVRRDGDVVRLFTRKGYDWSDRYSGLVYGR
jgi:hypothetical protein